MWCRLFDCKIENSTFGLPLVVGNIFALTDARVLYKTVARFLTTRYRFPFRHPPFFFLFSLGRRRGGEKKKKKKSFFTRTCLSNRYFGKSNGITNTPWKCNFFYVSNKLISRNILTRGRGVIGRGFSVFQFQKGRIILFTFLIMYFCFVYVLFILQFSSQNI